MIRGQSRAHEPLVEPRRVNAAQSLRRVDLRVTQSPRDRGSPRIFLACDHDRHIVAVAIELLGKVTDQLSTERMPRRA